MKTIHKLVLKAYLGPMVLTFFIVMFVLMMNIVWRYIDELVGKGLSAGIIIELMTYFMANMIPLGLPLAMLLAAIMTMGNLGENYELLAMKSAGMSLIRITKPLIILVSLISVGSFFIGNNLVPYANKKVFSILYDIRQQKQSLEFQDGLFFNGIDNMSIRVSRQEPETHLLHDVLIYDNRAANGDMNTIVADSGYIRLSDDKKYLLVTLFNGETYEQTRSSQWFTQSKLRHHIFEKQDQVIPMEGFAMGRTDANQFSNSQTKNINELQHDIESGAHAGQELPQHVLVRRVGGKRGAQPALPQQSRMAQEDVAAGVDHDLLPDRRTARRHHPQGRTGTSGRRVDHLLRDLLHHQSVRRETGQGGKLGRRIRHVALDVHPHAHSDLPDLQGHERLGAARHGLVRRKIQGALRTHATRDQQIEKRYKTQTKWQKARF